MTARRAEPRDADELVRLREVMLRSMRTPGWADDWQSAARQTFRTRLADETMAAFVVDRPAGAGLAACAVGTIETRLGTPGDPHGRSGYVFNVATDPGMRRRGFSQQCMTALLDWFAERGVGKVELKASRDGEPLYESLGFVRTPDPAMRLRLPIA
ncbi:hypothetical protein GCM10010172_68680 [Paractinoplanes ferrugineus]|uniref:N-acetyltransferase domain-containing protein n=1 Tax=Paractinoplanes ferrugineus TaxID=113564 RepID=A0A919J208_9ACTN|nr:GNAT family N-acetyltransferase [Actinoplanes ferrugineus]GIE12239.1 hypothetical protein Afe05nite_40790 [Actinoplanes ferrugineus]